ncbi:MAG TPA: asparagine synthase-related protein [Anaerolineales bacterium]|nr:asparagine synthase-related protein [Anaerolineales bacterium]
MDAIVGFSLYYQLTNESEQRALAAQHRALSQFKNLVQKTLVIGESKFHFWGRGDPVVRIHRSAGGSTLALIGSPHNEINWRGVEEALCKTEKSEGFELPWEGRVILLRISTDGKRWTLWNDWLGSIPVFHAEIGRGRIASTLEPVVVASAGYTPEDFFLPAVVSLLINGHYLADWTLYKGMKVIPPDSCMEWGEKGFRAERLWTVVPSQSRWEAGWDDLVDEMHELSCQAVKQALDSYPKWILPLSSGLDSRLIAGVAAEVGADAHAYTWGAPHTTDAVNSQKIARTLGFPWKRVDLPRDFLVTYTPRWADWFGSALHFHGMYQMAFLDRIASEPPAPIISGYVGDVLAGDPVKDMDAVHRGRRSYQLESDWYCHWTADEVRAHAKFPLAEALEANAEEYQKQIASLPGAFYQKLQLLELWNRQRLFTSFQSILSDYWRGVATPFLNRAYARFCLSIPRAALDDRRLLSDVFRRYYGKLAVISGTYAPDPLILTGRYLILRRIAGILAPAFHRGPLKGFGNVQLRMDIESVQHSGWKALWPLFEARDQLSNWLDFNQLERDFQTIMISKEDIRPLRRLQSAQTLAYRLL